MPDYFNQYSPIAAQAANMYGLDQSIFFGLIQTESSWNPYADAPGSSAYGFTQLLKGTAGDLGVNRFDPTQNLFGGAKYLSQLYNKYGSYDLALQHYYGSSSSADNQGYAKKVLNNAKKFGSSTGKQLLNEGGQLLEQGLKTGLNSVVPGLGNIADGIFGGITGGGLSNPITDFLNWIRQGFKNFAIRTSIIIIGFIVLLIALYMIAQKNDINIGKVIK